MIDSQGHATNFGDACIEGFCSIVLCFAFLFLGLFYISFFFLFVLHCFLFFALYFFCFLFVASIFHILPPLMWHSCGIKVLNNVVPLLLLRLCSDVMHGCSSNSAFILSCFVFNFFSSSCLFHHCFLFFCFVFFFLLATFLFPGILAQHS